MLIKPARPGLGLKNPETRQLIPEDSPTEVPDNALWRRRLLFNEVVIVEPGEAEPPPTEPAAKPKKRAAPEAVEPDAAPAAKPTTKAKAAGKRRSKGS